MYFHLEHKHPGVLIEADFENSFKITKDERVRLQVEREKPGLAGGKRKRAQTGSEGSVKTKKPRGGQAVA